MTAAFAHKRPGAGTVLSTFFYMWLIVGLVLGTAVLIGPVRVLTEGMGDAGWEQRSQDHVLIIVILLYLALSLVLTRYVVGIMLRARNRNTRWGIAAVFTVMGAATAWQWQNPANLLASIAGGGDAGTFAAAGGAEFVFGAYPDEDKLRELQLKGITSVISLQHPGVIVEREGISAEKDATEKLGITLIQAPMLPWVSDNAESLTKLRLIARRGKGKFYVHCGLGRDRVNVAKRVIESEGKKVAVASNLIAATGFADRATPFERGSLAEIDNGKWMVPSLNEHEMFGFLLGGQGGHVISLLDTTHQEQADQQRLLRRQLVEHNVPFSAMPLKIGDRARAREIARIIHSMPGKLTIVAPETPTPEGREQGRSEVASSVVRAYGRIAPKSLAARPSWKPRGKPTNPDSPAVEIRR
ncbi:MAG: hypothetical protein WD802_11960 [Gemmatimonadaceae bacterium]